MTKGEKDKKESTKGKRRGQMILSATSYDGISWICQSLRRHTLFDQAVKELLANLSDVESF